MYDNSSFPWLRSWINTRLNSLIICTSGWICPPSKIFSSPRLKLSAVGLNFVHTTPPLYNIITRLSSIVSQPIKVVVVVVIVVDADADADTDAFVVVVVDDFVAIQKLAIKFSQNRVNNG